METNKQSSYWIGSVRIGGQAYPRFMGGPLDGFTDAPFRQLVRQFSPQALLYTEMRHVSCVAHDAGGKKSLNFLQQERPLQYQITASSLVDIERAVARILAVGVDGIDLNIACPARNVVKSRSGSAVMADMPLLKEILTVLRDLVKLPLTVKMRAGFKEKNALDVVRLVTDCGVDALAIHPRLQTEGFAGTPDWDLVAAVKKTTPIPVLYSGGIIDFASAQAVYERTGVDGFLIGRGMQGAPWKLAALQAAARGEPYIVSSQTICAVALEHLALMCHYYGDDGLYNFRKFIPFYVKDGDGASALRQRLMVCESVAGVREGLRAFLKEV